MIVVDGVSAGQSCVDALRESEAAKRGDIIVVVHIGSTPAKNDKRYANRRTEVWFNTRDWLARGGALPRVPGLRQELMSPSYGYEPDTRYVLEEKKKLVKRLKRSPNLADALTLATSITPPNVAAEARSALELDDDY
jgi:hypothetical protein